MATPLHRCAGGQSVAHVKALRSNRYDGHPEIERALGAELVRVVTRPEAHPRSGKFALMV